MPDTQKDISDFISKLLAEHGHEQEINLDDSLILSGLLDSLAVLHIVVFLEENFGIDFSEIYFDQASFDSVNKIMDFIHEHQQITSTNLSH